MTKKMITLFVAGLLFLSPLQAKETAPVNLSAGPYEPEIASLVTTYLAYYHYGKRRLDDDISKRLFDAYLESLDPNRVFFLASDIADFKKHETQLDDALLQNPVNLDIPFLIFNRYKQRLNERVDVSLALLKRDFDFSKNDHIQYDRSETPWAKTTAELDELWRKRIKEDILRFKLREKPKDEYMPILEKRYSRLKKDINELETIDILERYLVSLATSFDPHSSYLKPATKDNFDIQMGHSLEGIGATLTRDGEYTKIVEVVKGGPADSTKQVFANDKIIAVAQGATGEFEDVVDLRLDKVVQKIRGPKGSVVRLTIIPADATDHSQTKEVTIIRDKVIITSADAKSEMKKVKDQDGKEYNVGVITIPSFYMDSEAKFRQDPNYKSTTRDVRNLLIKLTKENVDGLVIDLRQNGGGSLDEAIRLTGLFIKDGPVVQVKDHQGQIAIEEDPDPSIMYDGPLLVLTSVFSASASEIFSSAVQDYGRGLVVGSKSTHGKGTVQNIIGLQTSLGRLMRKNFDKDVAGALKITTHKFYRVSGGSTQFKGVLPDIVLPSPYDGLDITEDTLDYALPWDEIRPAPFKPFDLVRDALPYLTANSSKRVNKDPEFGYVLEDIAYRKKIEERNKVSLKYEERLKEKERLEAIAEKRKEERKLRMVAVVDTKDSKDAEDKDEVKVPDYILNESLYIIRDYFVFRENRVAVNGKKDSL